MDLQVARVGDSQAWDRPKLGKAQINTSGA
jgi:hypothetical protein